VRRPAYLRERGPRGRRCGPGHDQAKACAAEREVNLLTFANGGSPSDVALIGCPGAVL
jgi:hypothetical protein